MKIQSCPKYETCNAPVCPIDVNNNNYIPTHLDEDSVCYYLIESVKDISRTHFQGDQLIQMLEIIDSVRDRISDRHSRISRKLKSAKNSESRMARRIKKNG